MLAIPVKPSCGGAPLKSVRNEIPLMCSPIFRDWKVAAPLNALETVRESLP